MAKTKRSKEDHDEKIMKENIQKRFEHMFTGPGEPLSNMSIQEVEALKARVATLESELESKQVQQQAAPIKMTTSEAVKGADHVFQPHELLEETKKDSEEDFGSNIQRVGKIGLLASIITASLYLYLALRFGHWQLYAWSVDIWILAFAVFASTILARRGRVTWGAGLLLTAIPLTFIGAVVLIEGIGLLLGISIVLLVSIIAGQTLPAKTASRAIVLGVLGGITAILLDVYLPAYRLPQPEIIHVFLPGILGVVILLYGYVTFRQFRNYKLRTKLIIAFITIVVGSVGIVAFLTNRSLQTSLTGDIGNKLSVLASAKASEVGQLIDRESDVLKALALNNTLQDAAEVASRKTLTQTEIEQLDNEWRIADANNNNSDTLVASVIHNDLTSELLQFQKEFPQHVEIFLTDRQGMNIAATNRTSDYYQADEEWWQMAYQKGLFIGQPEYDESSKTIAMIMAVAVRANGNIVGILRTTVDFRTLTHLLNSGSFGKTGHTDIYLPNAQEITLKTGQSSSELILENAELDIHELTKSTQAYQQVLHNQMPSLASQAPVATLGDIEEDAKTVTNLNWHVVVLQDRADAMQPVEAQTRSILFSAIAIAILTTLAALGMAQILSGPIIRLNAVAEKVASGDLSAQAEVETGDETGTLATTFNAMTTQLKNMIGNLERRVADRTHDLELASDVGRTITEKVANPSEMLTTAAELIRSRFELYYTQVYLTDTAGQKLMLRAGTGEVGTQLLDRGHYLLIDTSSLNGRSVLEKKPIIVADTHQSPSFKPNPLLPKTRSEMTVPLITDNQVIGVLDMQSEQPGTFTESNLAAFEALAGQLAIAIQNANLFAEAEEARSQMEMQMRRFTEQGWQDFLNAIDHEQRIGFAFDQSKVIRLEPENLSTKVNELDVHIPIAIIGAKVGEIQLPTEEGRSWTQHELELIEVTSAQLAQHIDNLRLLAQADQYRAQAEQAARRLTREGWDSYLQTYGQSEPGYLYDLIEVRPLPEKTSDTTDDSIKYPVLVRNEVIGELVVDLPHRSEAVNEILAAVAEQLSGHLENLRLSELNEKRASREHALSQITSALRSSTNPATIMRTAVRELGSILGRSAVVQLAGSVESGLAKSAAIENSSSASQS